MRTTIIWLLLLPLTGLAQGNPAENNRFRAPFTLKTSLLNYINPVQQSIDALVDVPVARRWGVELGVSWVVESATFTTYQNETYRGFKWKPAVKYYIYQSDRSDIYIGLAFKYNRIFNTRYIDFIRQGGQYAETKLLRKQMDTWGASFRVGIHSYLGKHKRLILENYLGLGGRQINVSPYPLPADAEILSRAQFFTIDRRPGIYSTPDFMLGFNIGWRFSAQRQEKVTDTHK